MECEFAIGRYSVVHTSTAAVSARAKDKLATSKTLAIKNAGALERAAGIREIPQRRNLVLPGRQVQPPREVAAVDGDDRARDPGRRGRREEKADARHV